MFSLRDRRKAKRHDATLLGLDDSVALDVTYLHAANVLLCELDAFTARASDMRSAWQAGAEHLPVALGAVGGTYTELGRTALVAFASRSRQLSPGEPVSPLAQLQTMLLVEFGDEVSFAGGAACITAHLASSRRDTGDRHLFDACTASLEDKGLGVVAGDVYALLVMLVALNPET